MLGKWEIYASPVGAADVLTQTLWAASKPFIHQPAASSRRPKHSYPILSLLNIYDPVADSIAKISGNCLAGPNVCI